MCVYVCVMQSQHAGLECGENVWYCASTGKGLNIASTKIGHSRANLYLFGHATVLGL